MDSNQDVGFGVDDHSQPYTHLEFKNDPSEFQFAILGDNSGGPRPGVVAAGLEKLNLLQPEFVLCLGDLVEGYTKPDGSPATVQTYRDWWEEFDGFLEALEMPFFFLPGNHDINNPASVEVWRERFGGSREYYHFRYRDTLFLMVNTEDPPKDTNALIEEDPERAEEIAEAYRGITEAITEGAETEQILKLLQPIEDFLGTINISDDQIDYFRGVLEANSDVRWTFVLMHAPAWWNPSGMDIDPGRFIEIENLLSDRPYTVFSAHTHVYRYVERNGRDYITAAMTGAMNIPRPGAIDHVIWVTMAHDGPKIANLLLSGIIDKYGPAEGDGTLEYGMYVP